MSQLNRVLNELKRGDSTSEFRLLICLVSLKRLSLKRESSLTHSEVRAHAMKHGLAVSNS